MNNHSFSTFANTISFNISRYPTPVEITDSKNYRGPDKSDQQAEKPGGVENGAARSEEEEEAGLSVSSAGGDTNSNIEYVPAEYFRGVDTHQFAQSGEISEQSKANNSSLSTPSFSLKGGDVCKARGPGQWEDIDSHDTSALGLHSDQHHHGGHILRPGVGVGGQTQAPRHSEW